VDGTGTFTISLDFELAWGIRDKRRLPGYAPNILGVRDAVPRMLELFERYGVHVTWATVGLLFFDDKEDLLGHLPAQRPSYADPALSPYPLIAGIGANERADPYHYGLSLIRQVQQCPAQEIGSHTFSHYYCLEPGQTPAEFGADLAAAKRAAARRGVALRSLVFPRNQFSQAYLRICREAGIDAVRGIQGPWRAHEDHGRDESILVRSHRRLDQYLPLTGHNCVMPQRHESGVIDIRSSRFLLPASSRIRSLSFLCLRRLCRSMSHAARSGSIYHLWWHPHNFGRDLADNIAFLTRVLDHYRELSEEFGMRSRNMGEIAGAALAGAGAVRQPRHQRPVASAVGN
jgi:peptidoglycan/xylan/chitin deacetylase (PgdA/CDA1 family)